MASFRCRDGQSVVEVRELASIKLDVPLQVRQGETIVVRAEASDVFGRSISLGGADVQWEASAPLRKVSACDDVLGICLSSTSQRLVADAKGTSEVRALFAGHQGVASIVVE